VKNTNLHIQEAQQTLTKINLKGSIPRYIIVKLSKAKDKETKLKTVREWQLITYKSSLMRLTANFSLELMEARRQWDNVLKVLKERL
jgi:hypothetical protein